MQCTKFTSSSTDGLLCSDQSKPNMGLFTPAINLRYLNSIWIFFDWILITVVLNVVKIWDRVNAVSLPAKDSLLPSMHPHWTLLTPPIKWCYSVPTLRVTNWLHLSSLVYRPLCLLTSVLSIESSFPSSYMTHSIAFAFLLLTLFCISVYRLLPCPFSWLPVADLLRVFQVWPCFSW